MEENRTGIDDHATSAPTTPLILSKVGMVRYAGERHTLISLSSEIDTMAVPSAVNVKALILHLEVFDVRVATW